MRDVSQVYPYLVLEEGGSVLGYAYAHPIAQRAAYGWGAELSIYLHPDAAGKGLGRRLYQGAGRITVIRVPTLGRETTSNQPPWRSTIHLAMDSPSPVPPVFRSRD